MVRFLAALSLALPGGALTAQARWRLVEDLRIGGEESGPGQFTWIHAVAVRPDGGIYILDREARAIRLFDARGKFVRQLGRLGEGPGEFTLAGGMMLAPDGRLWVHDTRNARITVFAPDGKVSATYPFTPVGAYLHWGAYFDAQGRLLERVMLPRRGSEETPVPEAMRRIDLRTGRTDTLALPACPFRSATPTQFIWRNDRGEALHMAVPFMGTPLSALDRSGRIWCAAPDRYQVRALAIGRGDSLAEIVRSNLAPVAVPTSERAAAMARVRAQAAKWPATQVPPNDPGRVPVTYPPIFGLDVDDTGQVWVRRQTATGVAADIWSPEGRLIATTELPGRGLSSRTIWIVGGALYGLVFDADDVPTLVRYRIVKG